jgi:hypothetical protein
VTAQGSAYHRFRRALDRGSVIEALSAATEIEVVGLVEALELTLLLADREPLKYERAALRWHARFVARRPAWMCVRATRCCTSRSDPETPEMQRGPC